MKLSAVKYLSDAILSKRYNIDIFELHDIIQNAYLIENELLQEISDEEILKEASKSAINYSTKRTYPEIRHLAYSNGFLEGINWYREQLKLRQ